MPADPNLAAQDVPRPASENLHTRLRNATFGRIAEIRLSSAELTPMSQKFVGT